MYKTGNVSFEKYLRLFLYVCMAIKYILLCIKRCSRKSHIFNWDYEEFGINKISKNVLNTSLLNVYVCLKVVRVKEVKEASLRSRNMERGRRMRLMYLADLDFIITIEYSAPGILFCE